jgi:hypothetical protein
MERNDSNTVACRHHWILGQPHEGFVRGTCKVCGAERQYQAFLDDYGFEPERPTIREDGLRRVLAEHTRRSLSAEVA